MRSWYYIDIQTSGLVSSGSFAAKHPEGRYFLSQHILTPWHQVHQSLFVWIAQDTKLSTVIYGDILVLDFQVQQTNTK